MKKGVYKTGILILRHCRFKNNREESMKNVIVYPDGSAAVDGKEAHGKDALSKVGTVTCSVDGIMITIHSNNVHRIREIDSQKLITNNDIIRANSTKLDQVQTRLRDVEDRISTLEMRLSGKRKKKMTHS